MEMTPAQLAIALKAHELVEFRRHSMNKEYTANCSKKRTRAWKAAQAGHYRSEDHAPL